MLSKYLNPQNDLAFKRIFGSEKNKDILIHFLNDILGRNDNPIQEVTFLKTAKDPEIAAQRSSTVDVMCQDQTGANFIVEMQVGHESGFIKRAQYYAAKAYIEQRGKDTAYKDLKEVIFIAITNFALFKREKAYMSHHAMLDKQTYKQQLKDFSFTFLELPKFKKDKAALATMVDKWLYFLKHAPDTSELEVPSIVGNDRIIEKAYDALNRFSWTPEEMRYYDAIEMKKAADKDILETAHQEGLEKGKLEGIQEGLEKGKLEGIQEGLEKGKLEIARKMLQKGLDLSLIQEVTRLTKKEIEKLH